MTLTVLGPISDTSLRLSDYGDLVMTTLITAPDRQGRDVPVLEGLTYLSAVRAPRRRRSEGLSNVSSYVQ